MYKNEFEAVYSVLLTMLDGENTGESGKNFAKEKAAEVLKALASVEKLDYQKSLRSGNVKCPLVK